MKKHTLILKPSEVSNTRCLTSASSFRTWETIAVTLAVCLVASGLVYWRLSGTSVNSAIAVGIHFPETYDQPLLIKLTDLAISILPLGARPVHAAMNKDVAKYIDAYQDTDIIQTKSSDKLKEDIILKQPGHPSIFQYKIDLSHYDFAKDDSGNLLFYGKGHAGDDSYKRFTIPAPFMVDATGKKSSTTDVTTDLQKDGLLTVRPSVAWLAQASYPVTLDPTVEIIILNIHSHPQQGQNWTINFTTQGTANLQIIPNDHATINDDQFVSLSCNGQNLQPQILANNVVSYPNWSCNGTGEVVFYTKTAGNHTMQFNFGGQIIYAYNSATTPTIFRSGGGNNGNDSYTKLLLHADGTGASFVDSSAAAHTITAYGNATQSATQNKFGGKSAYFAGVTGDRLTIPDSADFNMGSANWTFDVWIYPAVLNTNKWVYTTGNGNSDNIGIVILAANNIRIDLRDTQGGVYFNSLDIATNLTSAWYHLAVVRSGGNLTIYWNGSQALTTTMPVGNTFNFATNIVGAYDAGINIYPFNGYIDELRISKGIARWTANFTPPTAPYSINPTGPPIIFRSGGNDSYTKLLLHADGPGASFVDNSQSVHTITAYGNATQSATQNKFGGKSLYFDGTVSYIEMSNSSDWDFLAGDFTIEAWFFEPSIQHQVNIFSQGWSGANFRTLQKDANGQIMFQSWGGGGTNVYYYTSNMGIAVNTWHHIAFVRSGNTAYLFLDGISISLTIYAPFTSSPLATFSNPLQVGYSIGYNSYTTGYIDELRVSKGIARWTANFTPPPSPYPINPTGPPIIFRR